MERRRVNLTVDALLITDGKAAYIAARNITVMEVFEVLGNAPRFFVRRNPQRGGEEYSMLGPTRAGRYLTVALEPVQGEEALWRLITAYPLNPRRGQRLYEGGT